MLSVYECIIIVKATVEQKLLRERINSRVVQSVPWDPGGPCPHPCHLDQIVLRVQGDLQLLGYQNLQGYQGVHFGPV